MGDPNVRSKNDRKFEYTITEVKPTTYKRPGLQYILEKYTTNRRGLAVTWPTIAKQNGAYNSEHQLGTGNIIRFLFTIGLSMEWCQSQI